MENNHKDIIDAMAYTLFTLFGDTDKEEEQEEQEEVETVDFKTAMEHLSLSVLFRQFSAITRLSYDEGTVLFLVLDKDSKYMQVKKWEGFRLTDYEFTEEDKQAEDWLLL